MKTKYIISFICSAAVCACGDLNLEESVYHTKVWQFSDFSQVKQVMTNVYGYVESGFSVVGGTMRDCATDDAVYARPSDPVMTFYDGSWGSLNTIDDKWSHYYAAIRSANYFLENCPEDFEQAKYMEDYKYDLAQLKNYPWEAKTLRAYFHFELLKRYNNIVIADKTFTESEANDTKPVTYRKAAEWIASELKGCAEHLPDNYVTGNMAKFSETGRVTKGFALALRSRVLLYAASPLNNPASDKTMYEAAASAAKDFIDYNNSEKMYAFSPFNFNNENSKDLIFGYKETAGSDFESANFPVGYEGGNSGICPSQNLVEAFEEGDLRMAKTIISNGDIFKNEIVETFTGGRNGAPRENATPTSYYLRKFIQEATSFEQGNYKYFQHVYPILRLPEVWLNYAEALFEATGNPSFKGSLGGVEYTVSPIEALDKVRTAAGLSEVSGLDANAFRTRLRNEIRVEFAFEDHRFWDIRRWKTGADATKVYGLVITKTSDATETSPATFETEKTLVRDGKWDEKMNFYPIPESELHKNTNLTQNTGW